MKCCKRNKSLQQSAIYNRKSGEKKMQDTNLHYFLLALSFDFSVNSVNSITTKKTE